MNVWRYICLVIFVDRLLTASRKIMWSSELDKTLKDIGKQLDECIDLRIECYGSRNGCFLAFTNKEGKLIGFWDDLFSGGFKLLPIDIRVKAMNSRIPQGKFPVCYYMVWKGIADTRVVAELTHRLRTRSRRLVHEFSLATGSATSISNHVFL